jgi:sporulation protein YlmC with PRC-barrel domain
MACPSLPLFPPTNTAGVRTIRAQRVQQRIIMRNKSMIIALVAGAVALATTNLKAQGANEMSPATRRPQAGLQGHNWKQTESASSSAGASNLKTSNIIGSGVFTDSGVRLGTVQDLIVNLDTHIAPFAIIEYGGTLGINETRVAVPLTDLKWSSETRQLILPATKEQFKTASTAPTGGWMAVVGQDWTKNVDRYYSQPSAAGTSRFERQEMSGMSEGREAVRNPSDEKGANSLDSQALGTDLANTNKVAKATDEALTTKVNSLIRQEAGDQANQIEVSITKGVVTLNGRVQSDAQKKKLVHQIMELPSVTRVEENLTTESH